MRITKPFLKAHLALLLLAHGAESVAVSVDAAEPTPARVFDILTKAGFAHTPNRKSSAKWTGHYKSLTGLRFWSRVNLAQTWKQYTHKTVTSWPNAKEN